MTKNRAEKHSARARMAANSEPYSVAAHAVASLTSWSSLDEALNGGFKPGQVYLVTAPSGASKLPLATNLIAKFALCKRRVLSMDSTLNSSDFNTAVLEAASGENAGDWRREIEKNESLKTIFIGLKPYVSHFAHAYSTAEIGAYLDEEKHDALVINGFEESIGDWRATVDGDAEALALKKLAVKYSMPVIVFADTDSTTSKPVTPALAEAADTVLELVRSADALELAVTKNSNGRISTPVKLRVKSGADLALIEA